MGFWVLAPCDRPKLEPRPIAEATARTNATAGADATAAANAKAKTGNGKSEIQGFFAALRMTT
jgi:hypothetical protein